MLLSLAVLALSESLLSLAVDGAALSFFAVSDDFDASDCPLVLSVVALSALALSCSEAALDFLFCSSLWISCFILASSL